jgi:hypothetical protein
MALAPEVSHAQMLSAAIFEATRVLGAPVTKLIAEGDRVTLWAERRRVSTRPRYIADHSDADHARPGSGGRWEIVLGPVTVDPED